MTSLALVFAASLFAQQPAQEPKPARITGKMIHAITGEPLRKVQLRLTRDQSPGRGQMPQSRAVTSDSEGKFLFDKLEAGTYRLSAQRVGFLNMQYGARSSNFNGTPIKLREGEELSLDFKLQPQGVITGRVVDQDGDPLPNVPVGVQKAAVSGSARDTSTGQTNDIGEFRIANLPPGKYYVVARPRGRRAFFDPRMQQQPAEEATEDYAPTYFPGALDTNAAAPVEVGPGREVSGIQIGLMKSPVYRVRGRVTGEGAAPNMMVQMNPRGQGQGFFFGRGFGGRVKPDGTFEITGVRPGSYTLSAMAMQRGPRAMGRTQVDVSADVDNVVLTMMPPVTVTGSVRMEGQTEQKFTGGRVFLRPSEMGGPPNSMAQVKEDGSFKLEGLTPDLYTPVIFGFPDGVYLRSVRLGNQQIGDQVDLTNAGGAPVLHLVLSPNAATLEGVVRKKEEAAAGVQVTLVPDPFDPGKPHLIRQVTTDQNGAFSLRSLPPGNYRLFSWIDPIPSSDLTAEFLKPLESGAEKLALKESARERVEAKLIELEAPPQ